MSSRFNIGSIYAMEGRRWQVQYIYAWLQKRNPAKHFVNIEYQFVCGCISFQYMYYEVVPKKPNQQGHDLNNWLLRKPLLSIPQTGTFLVLGAPRRMWEFICELWIFIVQMLIKCISDDDQNFLTNYIPAHVYGRPNSIMDTHCANINP